MKLGSGSRWLEKRKKTRRRVKTRSEACVWMASPSSDARAPFTVATQDPAWV